MPLPIVESQELLQAVALDLMQEFKEPRISAEDLAQLVDKHLTRLDTQDPVTSEDFIDKIRDVSKIIKVGITYYAIATLQSNFYSFMIK